MDQAAGWGIDAVSYWANNRCGDEYKYDTDRAHR